MDDGSRFRVLIVEDERLARGALQRILELDGYAVRVAGDGLGAVRVLKSFKPDFVIMDWCLPGLSGEALLNEIRRTRPDLPVVIISSSDEAFASGVDVNARLRKPLDVRRLRAAVARLSPRGANAHADGG